MTDAIDKLFQTAKTDAGIPTVSVVMPDTITNSQHSLPIELLDDMEQPFKLYSPADAEAMRKSVAAHGVIQSLLVRPHGEGRYQIVSGRNRRNGARAAGLTDVPCEVRALSDDEAEELMIETNLNQRPKILPSERAWAYRKLLEIAKRQGQKIELEEDGGSDCHKSRDALGASDGLRGRQVQNYVSLTNLTQELMDKVDEEKLAINAGVQLSYLSPENQTVVHDFFFASRNGTISEDLSTAIRNIGEKKKLSAEILLKLMAGQGKAKKQRVTSIPFRQLKRFFPREVTKTQAQATTAAALKYYFDNGQSVVDGEE